MNKFIESLKKSWVIILAIFTIIGFTTALFTVDSRYVKVTDAKAQEQRQAKTFDQVRETIEIQNQSFRLQSLMDREKMYQVWVSQNPGRTDLVNELNNIRIDRDKTLEKIKDLTSPKVGN
jgi:predicted membrane protein